jgi:phosphate-selective porin OprO and OprP
MKALLLLLAMMALGAVPVLSQTQDSTGPATEATPDNPQNTTQAPSTTNNTQAATQAPSTPTLENTLDATESEEKPRRQLVHWNEYHGPHFTIRFGGGFLYDFAAYAQDNQSKQQIALSPGEKLRDFRFVLGGTFPDFTRSVTWSAGIMYDAPTHSWLVRQTGVQIQIPKLWGYLFIGRGKEGFSLNKVMTGYDGWTMERSTMNDATIPILADGFKWLGYSPKHGFLWNLGYYNDLLSKGQTFSSYHNQEVARLAWLPIHSDAERTVLHLGVNLRNGKPVNNQLQLRSRPEAFPAPYFVDTGKFPASATRMAGYEIYYRNGPWLFGSEYWFTHVSSPSRGNPTFNGGDVVATWLITGETREYNTIGGFFRGVSPARPVFEGGPGAWELVFRYSHIDLDSQAINGGKFGRFTPQVNWYLSDNVRLEFAYGYGHLDRFDLKGNTQFFQTRIQLTL